MNLSQFTDCYERQLMEIAKYRMDYLDYMEEKYRNMEESDCAINIKTLEIVEGKQQKGKNYRAPEFGTLNSYYCEPAQKLIQEVEQSNKTSAISQRNISKCEKNTSALSLNLNMNASSSNSNDEEIVKNNCENEVMQRNQDFTSVYEDLPIDDLSLSNISFSEISNGNSKIESFQKNTHALNLSLQKSKNYLHDQEEMTVCNYETSCINNSVNSSGSNTNDEEIVKSNYDIPYTKATTKSKRSNTNNDTYFKKFNAADSKPFATKYNYKTSCVNNLVNSSNSNDEEIVKSNYEIPYTKVTRKSKRIQNVNSLKLCHTNNFMKLNDVDSKPKNANDTKKLILINQNIKNKTNFVSNSPIGKCLSKYSKNVHIKRKFLKAVTYKK